MVSVDDEAPIRYVVIGEDNDSELDSHQLDGDNDNLNPSFTLEYFQDANYNSSQIPDSSSYDNGYVRFIQF
ncbi:unnamed protein product [Anisakis simplex]|uniref:Cadherin domain-containing protein n=1 Tax=Anisakis simplex TaxID=6269 RepID=A0A0M3JUI2_ANISI|nr:unnamed protein product [Anisakis simplex]